MNRYMDFDPYTIRERNEQMRREVNRCASKSGREITTVRAARGSLSSLAGVHCRCCAERGS
jgi:hypothetical protein